MSGTEETSGIGENAPSSAPDVVVEPPVALSRGAAVGPLLVVALVTVMAALVTVAFLPWRLGTVALPVSVLLSAVALWWGARTAYRLRRTMVAALMPVLTWVVLVFLMSAYPWRGFPMLPTDWRTPLLLGTGALVGAVVCGGLWGDHLAAKVAAERARGVGAAPSTGPLP